MAALQPGRLACCYDAQVPARVYLVATPAQAMHLKHSVCHLQAAVERVCPCWVLHPAARLAVLVPGNALLVQQPCSIDPANVAVW